MDNDNENKILEKIKSGDIQAFKSFFHTYYPYLCNYAAKFVNETDAEEIVQDFFVSFWEKRSSLQINTSLKNYLFRSVYNKCLNHLQHKKIEASYAQEKIKEISSKQDYSDFMLEVELSEKIQESINSLPKERKKIFLMNREKGLTYKEIANTLNISIKTVENQIGSALKTLREKLNDYITSILL